CSLLSMWSSGARGAQQLAGERVGAGGERRRTRTVDDVSSIEHRDPVGDRPGQAEIVRDHDLRAAARPPDAGDQLADLLGEERIEVGGRLVVEDELGVDGEGARDGGALAHTARQVPRQLGLRAGQLHLLERVPDPPRHLGRGRLVMLAQPQRDVLGHGERRQEGCALEDHRDAKGLLAGRVREVALERDAADLDAAGVGALEADDLAEQHRLSLPALSHDGDQLARLDLEVDSGEHLLRAVPLAHPVEDDGDPAVVGAGHAKVKLRRTIRKSRIRIHTKLHTTAAVVEPAMPSAPPRVRRPNVEGTRAATTPKAAPFSRPVRTSPSFTHSNMRWKGAETGRLMAGAGATTAAPPRMPTKSSYSTSRGRASVDATSRGTTRKRTGSMSIVRSAPISSYTVIDPSSAAIEEPVRPARRKPIITGPISFVMARPTMGPRTLWLTLRNWSADWTTSTMPTKRDSVAAMGALSVPMRTSCATMRSRSVAPKRSWRHAVANRLTPSPISWSVDSTAAPVRAVRPVRMVSASAATRRLRRGLGIDEEGRAKAAPLARREPPEKAPVEPPRRARVPAEDAPQRCPHGEHAPVRWQEAVHQRGDLTGRPAVVSVASQQPEERVEISRAVRVLVALPLVAPDDEKA